MLTAYSFHYGLESKSNAWYFSIINLIMGSGAGKEKPQSDGTKPAENKIFLDEGVGIESSNISRKWTTKLSLFRNMETLRPAETPRNQSGTMMRQE